MSAGMQVVARRVAAVSLAHAEPYALFSIGTALELPADDKVHPEVPNALHGLSPALISSEGSQSWQRFPRDRVLPVTAAVIASPKGVAFSQMVWCSSVRIV